MQDPTLLLVLADLVLFLHVAIVVFIVGALALIIAGGLCGWRWVRNPWFRIALSFFFYFFHQFFYWVLSRALLGEAVNFDFQQVLVFATLNAAVAAPLYRMLDKLRVAG